MAGIITEIGADSKQFDRVIATLPDKVEKVSRRMNAAGGGGGMRGMNLGMAAMQMQDVAVQLQMGTRVATIMAQQGSQLLSMFGTGGMIAGGVLAVAGLFYTMGQRGADALKEITKASKDLNAEAPLMLATINADSLSSSLKRVRDLMVAAKKEQDNLSGFWGFLTANVTGNDPTGTWEKLFKEREQLAELQGKMVDQTLVRESKRVEVSKLIAEGKNDEADALERSLKLNEELQKIEAMQIQPWAKEHLKRFVNERSSLEERTRMQKDAASGDDLRNEAIRGSKDRIKKAAEKAAEDSDDLRQKAVIAAQKNHADVASRLNDLASKGESRMQDFIGAAFSPLKGDADISTGRGSNVNPLTRGASEQVKKMAEQVNLLKKQAASLDKSATHLASIDAQIKKMDIRTVYN